jgi:Endosomal/lysosomal potassium channel TMEM175
MKLNAETHGAGAASNTSRDFSDAVFAIALTVLIVEIKLPGSPEGAMDERLAPDFLRQMTRRYGIATLLQIVAVPSGARGVARRGGYRAAVYRVFPAVAAQTALQARRGAKREGETGRVATARPLGETRRRRLTPGRERPQPLRAIARGEAKIRVSLATRRPPPVRRVQIRKQNALPRCVEACGFCVVGQALRLPQTGDHGKRCARPTNHGTHARAHALPGLSGTSPKIDRRKKID